MFRLEIKTDNAAFEPNPTDELARILVLLGGSLLGDPIHMPTQSGTVRDINGNTVGSWKYEMPQESRGLPPVPDDFPVQPLGPDDPAVDRVTCGDCGRSWDDSISTTWTPVPAGRCPFEYFH